MNTDRHSTRSTARSPARGPLTHEDVDRCIAEARAMRSREVARLSRRLFELPGRALVALRGVGAAGRVRRA